MAEPSLYLPCCLIKEGQMWKELSATEGKQLREVSEEMEREVNIQVG